MSLDVNRLKYVKRITKGNELVIIAQCPACLEENRDLTRRNHLIVYPDGRFGCAVNPGDEEHRRKVFALVGQKDRGTNTVAIRVTSTAKTCAIKTRVVRIPLAQQGKSMPELFRLFCDWRKAQLPVGVHWESPAGLDAGQGASRLALVPVGGPPVLVDLTPMDTTMRQAMWAQLSQLTLIAHDAGNLIPILVGPGDNWPVNFHCAVTMVKVLENQANPEGQKGEEFGYDLASLARRYCPEVLEQGNLAKCLHPLFQKLLAQIVEADLVRVWRLEQNVMTVVHRMKAIGIGVDRERLSQVHADYLARAEAEARECRQLLGQPNLNLDASEDVLTAFKANGITIEATGAEDLCMVAHPAADALREYRQYRTVVRDAEKVLNCVGTDGRIHPDWDLLGTGTGRMSCTNPPVQSLSGNLDLRRCLVPRPGHVFIEGDYAQADLRPIAFASQDTKILEIFTTGSDFHRITTSGLLGKSLTEVTPEERQVSKALLYGIIYSMGVEKLRRQARLRFGLVWSTDEAQEHLARFYALYPGLETWRKQVEQEAHTATECRTLGFRRRRLLPTGPEHHHFRFVRMLNMVAQGTVADAVKVAMVEVDRQLRGRGAVVVNSYDGLVIDVPEPQADESAEMLRVTMEAALGKLIPGVPVVAETKVLHWLA